jgi:hypothetical protein
MDRLRIGLLLTAPKANHSELALAQWTRRQPGLEMTSLIIQGINQTHGTNHPNGARGIKGQNRLAAMSLSLLIQLESLALRRHPRFHHHTARIEPGDLGAQTGALSDCDLLICLDPTVSPADLSALAKRTHQGLLALRTGRGLEQSSEPAGFWEVALQRDVTTFTIEHVPPHDEVNRTEARRTAHGRQPHSLSRGLCDPVLFPAESGNAPGTSQRGDSTPPRTWPRSI